MDRKTALVALVICALAAAGSPALAVTADHLFLVSIDGCAPRYLRQLDVPNLRRLTETGSWTLRARTVMPPMTLPATASMVSGVSVRQHDIDWDEYAPGRGPIRVSTIFTEVRRAGGSCAGFVGPRKLEHLAPQGVFDEFLSLGEDDRTVMDAALRYLAQEDPARVYFIQLPGVEIAGERHGWGSAEYFAAVVEADRQIGRLLQGIYQAGMATKSVMIVTADHGGEGRRHDLNASTVVEIPWIISGIGVRTGYEIPDEVRIYDTAAVALRALGLTVPTSWEGRVPQRVLPSQ